MFYVKETIFLGYMIRLNEILMEQTKLDVVKE